MVASEHPLVSQTGVDIMRRGGNAFDAAMAMSALLPVVRPAANHLGGDAYILAYPAREGRVTAICSGGKAPAAATKDRFANGTVYRHGGAAASIPGLVDAWQEFSSRWCTMPLRDLLAPAISYARDGFVVSKQLSALLGASGGLFTKYTGLRDLLFPEASAPRFGSVLRQPSLARHLAAIADGGRQAFYEGPLATRIADGVQAAGGFMTAEDLKSHAADVLEPIAVEYRGHTVYETPPNSQGHILLEELKIAEGFDVRGMGHLSADTVHTLVEAKKLAFEDRQTRAGDPAFTGFDPRTLLTDEHVGSRRARIDPQRAQVSTAVAASHDTTSFVVADRDGNVCSFIQSLFAPWGSAVCIDGIIMNNRMTGFSLEDGHPNELAPGKRTMHTLNTYLAFKDGRPLLVGNTPGGDFQVQTNLQVLTAALDFGLDPQAAVDAPRWGDTPEGLLVEAEMPAATQDELGRRGHNIRVVPREMNPMGHAQLIALDPHSGALLGGSDTRAEGCAAGW
jgi:gamma-glutamyltranspeptidase/glutathione hydrolase